MTFTVGSVGGVQELHKAIRGLSYAYPAFYAFGSIADTDNLVDTLSSMPGDTIHKTVVWSQSGSNSLYEVVLSTADANGSFINAEGLITTETVNTGILWAIDESVVFDKDDTFFLQVEGEVQIDN